MAQGEGPFKVYERIRDNAYKLELPGDMKVSATFNMHDLAPYMEDDFQNLRVNPSEEGETHAY